MNNGGFAAQYHVSFTASFGYVPLKYAPSRLPQLPCLACICAVLGGGYA